MSPGIQLHASRIGVVFESVLGWQPVIPHKRCSGIDAVGEFEVGRVVGGAPAGASVGSSLKT